jgi:hypothetical protein
MFELSDGATLLLNEIFVNPVMPSIRERPEDTRRKGRLSVNLLAPMPDSVARALGDLLYRHIG